MTSYEGYAIVQRVGGKGKSPFGTAGAMSDLLSVTCDVAEDLLR